MIAFRLNCHNDAMRRPLDCVNKNNYLHVEKSTINSAMLKMNFELSMILWRLFNGTFDMDSMDEEK